MVNLRRVSGGVLVQLRNEVTQNIGRYLGEGFSEFASAPGWAIQRDLEVDLSALTQLDGSDRAAERRSRAHRPELTYSCRGAAGCDFACATPRTASR